MPRDDLGFLAGDVGKAVAYRLGDTTMKHEPAALEQALIGCFLHQRVLEDVGRVRCGTRGHNKTSCLELNECCLERRLVRCRDRVQQRERELTPDRGADLRHVLDRRQPIETRHQGAAQRHRNAERRQQACKLLFVDLSPHNTDLDHRLAQFLDEERDAIGSLDDHRDVLLRK